jgi:hypothetical protein
LLGPHVAAMRGPGYDPAGPARDAPLTGRRPDASIPFLALLAASALAPPLRTPRPRPTPPASPARCLAPVGAPCRATQAPRTRWWTAKRGRRKSVQDIEYPRLWLIDQAEEQCRMQALLARSSGRQRHQIYEFHLTLRP